MTIEQRRAVRTESPLVIEFGLFDGALAVLADAIKAAVQ
jgi:hypothetical protein